MTTPIKSAVDALNPNVAPEFKRTEAEIVVRIDAIKDKDVFGFETGDLIGYLPYDAAKPYLKPDYDGKDWKPAARDRESVRAQLTDYMSFAWDKANNCRGLSAGRSLMHMRAWLWMMGEDDFLAALDPLSYDRYGKPQLREICEYLGIDWRALDNDSWTNNEGEEGLPADRVPRLEDCARFMPTKPAPESPPKPSPQLSHTTGMLCFEALRAAVVSVPMPTRIGLGAAGLEFRYPSWFAQARAAIAAAEKELQP